MLLPEINSINQASDRLIVMYKGEIIEKGGAAKIFSNPIENYTKVCYTQDQIIKLS